MLKTPEDFRQITDADIDNVWYVQALRGLEGARTPYLGCSLRRQGRCDTVTPQVRHRLALEVEAARSWRRNGDDSVA